MQDWFVTLGYITLTAGMLLFLFGVLSAIVVAVWYATKDWREEKKCAHDMREYLKEKGD